MTTPTTQGGVGPMAVIGRAIAILIGVPLVIGIIVAILMTAI